MSATGKKAAISGFFSKNKKKAPGATGGAGAAESDSIIKSSDLGVPGITSDSGAWADSVVDPEDGMARESAIGGAVAAKLHMAVADLAVDDDLDDDEKLRRSLEAQEARRALNLARQHAREKQAAAAVAAPAPAPVAAPIQSGKWVPKSLAERSAESSTTATRSSDKEPNIKDERAFPTLGRAMSGLPVGAKILTQEKGLAGLASRNQWAELAVGEEEAEDEYAGEAAPSNGAAAGPAAAAAPAQTQPDMEGPPAEGLARPIAGATVYESDRDTKEEVEKICSELRGSKDYGEAIRRLRDEMAFPMGRLVHSRVIAAETVALFALDQTEMPARMTLGKLLAILVPAKIVSRVMLNMAVGRVCARLDVPAWASDYPKAKEWLADILNSGTIVGGKLWHPADASGAAGLSAAAKAAAAAIPAHDAQAIRDGGYVPLAFVHPKVAASMNLTGGKATASQLMELGKELAPISRTLRKEYGDEEEEEEPAPKAPEAAAPVAPSAARTSLSDLSHGASEAAKKGGVDEDGPSALGKKKKKKAKAKADDDEDDTNIDDI